MAKVRIVRDEQQPRHWWWLVVIALGMLTVWQVYELGSWRGALRVGENLDDRAALLAVQDRSFVQLEQQQARIRELRAQLETQRKLTDLEVHASVEMQKELQSALLQQHQLLEQVQFYENIVGTDASKAGVRLAEMRLQPGEKPGLWWLNVTMTQVKKHDIRATGKIEVSVFGSLNGQSIEMAMPQLHPQGLSSVKFGYRYFQNVAIPLQLPNDFVANELALTIDVRKPKRSQMLEQREWIALQR